MNEIEVRIIDDEGNVDIFTDVTNVMVDKTSVKVRRAGNYELFQSETTDEIRIKMSR